jgi:transposase
MTLVLLVSAIGTLVLPALACSLGRRLPPAEWARLCVVLLAVGAAAVEVALLVIGLTSVLDLAGVHEFAEFCERMLGTALPGGVLSGLAVAGAAGLLARRERGSGLSPAAQQLVTVALRTLDHLDAELDLLRRELVGFARRQPGCRALDALYGIGPVAAVAIWAELGDVGRFSSSRFAVRHTGLDITVWSSDGKRTPGHLARQGPPVLRWALFEAAKCAARPTSPDHAYYLQVRDRLGGNRAALAVARKLARRCYHTLAALGDQAFAPPCDIPQLGQVA